jgi:hypothetical protein
MKEHRFEIVQEGMVVAGVTSPSEAKGFMEAMRYAMQYRQDGPVTMRYKNPKDASWVEVHLSGKVSQPKWPVLAATPREG